MQLPENILYDVRLAERYIAKGWLKREDYEKAKQKLEDLASQAIVTPIDEYILPAMSRAERRRAAAADAPASSKLDRSKN